MWEWTYGKEPFDMKLTLLRLLKKIWILPMAALIGAAIVGGGYHLSETVFGDPAEYRVTSSYYVEYGKDPLTDVEFTFINHVTWNTWVTTDWFVDRIWESAIEGGLNPEKYGITKEDLPSFLSADLPSDLRIPVSMVTTTDSELTGILAPAVEHAFLLFGEEQREIDKIRVIDTTDVELVDPDIRTFRACVLGAVLAVFFSLFGALLYIVLDDGIYLPETFSYRYGIPVLGTVCGYGEGAKMLDGSIENIVYKTSECNVVALTSVEEDTDIVTVKNLLKNDKYLCMPAITQVPEASSKLREADGILLLVQAGVSNGKMVAHVLHDLCIHDCNVQGAILVDADEGLIKAYRMTGYRRAK